MTSNREQLKLALKQKLAMKKVKRDVTNWYIKRTVMRRDFQAQYDAMWKRFHAVGGTITEWRELLQKLQFDIFI